MRPTERRTSYPPPAKADPAAVAVVADWLRGLPADEVRRHANSGSPSVRQAAALVLAELLEGRTR